MIVLYVSEKIVILFVFVFVWYGVCMFVCMVGRPPGPEMENSVDRESYSLAAGLALGLVVLGKGSKLCGLGDLAVPDKLHYYMVGGHRRPLTGKWGTCLF